MTNTEEKACVQLTLEVKDPEVIAIFRKFFSNDETERENKRN